MNKTCRLFLTIILIVLLTSCGGIGTTAEFMIGTTRQYVFDTLGEPDTIFYGTTYWSTDTTDADAYHFYGTVGLSFRIFGNEVKDITLVNDDWILSNGLVVGLSLSQALAILGDEYTYFDGAGKDFYEYSEYAIMIEVSDSTSKILEINLQEGNPTVLYW